MEESKSFVAKIENSESNLWGNRIRVPKEIADYFNQKKIKRLMCHIESEIKIHCAIMSPKTDPFILINKAITKQLQGKKELTVHLSKDDSKYGMEMPEELNACLKEDPIALNYFENLSPGKQRNLIHMVAKVKSSEIKIRRSLSILEHLVRESGKVDFKKLNEVIKEFNQKFKIN